MYRNRIPYKPFNFNNSLEKNKTVEYYRKLLKQKTEDIEKSKEPPKPKNYYQKNS